MWLFQKMYSCVFLFIALLLSGCQFLPATEWPFPEDDMMTMSEEETISAQVVLKPPKGKTLDGTSQITSDNAQEFVPSTEFIKMATDFFTSAGFKVEAVVGNSFSITASVGTFERVFNARLRRHASRGIEVLNADGSSSYELPTVELPKSIADLIELITFTPPPDFGPTNFGP